MKPLISAHRGGAVREGRPASQRYAAAIAMGVDFVEVDVRKTSDGVAIVCHDDRTASGRLVSSLAYAEVEAELGPEALTFEEILDLAAGRTRLHVDLKEGGYEDEVVNAVRARFPVDGFVITSEDAVVRTVKERHPEVRAGLSLGDELRGAPPWRRLRVRLSEAFPGRRIEACRADFVAVQWQLADFNVLRHCERHGMPAWVWTVDSDRDIARFVSDPRVTTLITNHPEVALRLRSAA